MGPRSRGRICERVCRETYGSFLTPRFTKHGRLIFGIGRIESRAVDRQREATFGRGHGKGDQGEQRPDLLVVHMSLYCASNQDLCDNFGLQQCYLSREYAILETLRPLMQERRPLSRGEMR